MATSIARLSDARVIPDHIESLIRLSMRAELGWNTARLSAAAVAKRLAKTGHAARPFGASTAGPLTILSGFTPDPVFDLGPPDPMWNLERVGGPTAWSTNAGDDDILVAVEDTGLDYTHTELADKVVEVTESAPPRVQASRSARTSSAEASPTPISPLSPAGRRTVTSTATARGSAATSPARSTGTRSTASLPVSPSSP